jgi:hypothetical protein
MDADKASAAVAVASDSTPMLDDDKRMVEALHTNIGRLALFEQAEEDEGFDAEICEAFSFSAPPPAPVPAPVSAQVPAAPVSAPALVSDQAAALAPTGGAQTGV